jgi:hypothetical protein
MVSCVVPPIAGSLLALRTRSVVAHGIPYLRRETTTISGRRGKSPYSTFANLPSISTKALPQSWGAFAEPPACRRVRLPGGAKAKPGIQAEACEIRNEARGDPKRNSRDPKRNSRDPKRSSRDPKRSSRDPKRTSRDPKRTSRDPKRSSRDPKRSSRDPKRSSRNPKRTSVDSNRSSGDSNRSISASKQSIEGSKRGWTALAGIAGTHVDVRLGGEPSLMLTTELRTTLPCATCGIIQHAKSRCRRSTSKPDSFTRRRKERAGSCDHGAWPGCGPSRATRARSALSRSVAGAPSVQRS